MNHSAVKAIILEDLEDFERSLVELGWTVKAFENSEAAKNLLKEVLIDMVKT